MFKLIKGLGSGCPSGAFNKLAVPSRGLQLFERFLKKRIIHGLWQKVYGFGFRV